MGITKSARAMQKCGMMITMIERAIHNVIPDSICQHISTTEIIGGLFDSFCGHVD